MIISKDKHQDTAYIIKQIKELGVVIMPGFLSEDDRSGLNAEFDLIFALPDSEFKKDLGLAHGKSASLDRKKIDGRILPVTKDYFSNEFMDQISEAYFNSKHYDLNDTIFVMNDLVGTKHIAQNLHYDVIPTLKFFIYLTDTTAENGAFSCVPGSHRYTMDLRNRKGRKISYKNRDMTRELPDLGEVISVEGIGGSLIIFTTEIFYKAGIVSKGERRIMRGHTRIKKNFAQKILDKIANL